MLAQFHTPRNILLAMVGEVGELCECFQWRGDAGAEAGLPGWEEKKRDALGDEMADVLLYLVRLADKCAVDLPGATRRKVRARGSSKCGCLECSRGSVRCVVTCALTCTAAEECAKVPSWPRQGQQQEGESRTYVPQAYSPGAAERRPLESRHTLAHTWQYNEYDVGTR